MKTVRIFAIALTLAFALFVLAQNGPGGAPQPGVPAPGGGMSNAPKGAGGVFGNDSVDDQLEYLTSQLSLSKSQQASARPILEEKTKAILDIRERRFPVAKPGSPPSPEGGKAMKEAMDGIHVKMLAILNDEQKKKYEALGLDSIELPKK